MGNSKRLTPLPDLLHHLLHLHFAYLWSFGVETADLLGLLLGKNGALELLILRLGHGVFLN